MAPSRVPGSDNALAAEGTVEVDDVRELAGTEDGAGTLEQITELIREKRLSPHDLVDLGRGWESIEDCDELSDVTAPLLRRARRASIARATLPLVVFVGSLALFAYDPINRWGQANPALAGFLVGAAELVSIGLWVWAGRREAEVS